MLRTIGALLTMLAVVALPSFVRAEDAKRPDRPNPEALFNRLDANHDGVITADEIPAGMRERFKDFLLQTIKSHGGKLTKAELVETIRHHRAEEHGGSANLSGGTLTITLANTYRGTTTVCPAAPGRGPAALHPMGPHSGPAGAMPARPAFPACPLGPPGPRPEAKVGGSANGTGALVINGNLVINGGTVIINGGTIVVGGPAAGAAAPGQAGHRPIHGAAAFPMLNARAIFDRLDTNKDGKLSFEEFAVGVRHLQQILAERMGGWKRPFGDGMQFFHEKWNQLRGQFGHPGMGPMGGHPDHGMGPMGGHPGFGMGPMGGHPGMGMGPMGPHPGMEPMGGHPGMGMGPMGPHPGMEPMGGHPGMGMGPMGGHPGMGMGPMGPHPGMGPMGHMMGSFGSLQAAGEGKVVVTVITATDDHGKKVAVCKCTATKPGECNKCAAKKHVACPKCGAKTPEQCTCGKKCDSQKPKGAEKPEAGHRSIEARLTALEAQQAEILRLLRSEKHDHRRGDR